jgi:hypothetical protein
MEETEITQGDLSAPYFCNSFGGKMASLAKKGHMKDHIILDIFLIYFFLTSIAIIVVGIQIRRFKPPNMENRKMKMKVTCD